MEYRSKLRIVAWNLDKLALTNFANVSQNRDYTLLTPIPFYILFLYSFIGLEFTHHKINPFKMYNAVVFSLFTNLCNHHNDLILEHFIIL